MKRCIVKLFFRSPAFWMLLLLFLVSYGFGIGLAALGYTGLRLLYVFVRANYYVCFVLTLLSFWLLSEGSRNGVKEAADCARNGFYERRTFAGLLSMVLLWNAGVAVLLALTSLCSDGTRYFLSWFPPVYLCGVFLPQLICLLVASFAAEGKNLVRWIPVLLLFLFLTSPLAEKICWKRQPQYPIDQLCNRIHWIFSIFYQNAVWSPDAQGCMQTEQVKIELLFFWLLLLGGAFLIRMYRKKAVGKIMVGCSLLLLAASFQPASLYRLDGRWDGMWRDYNIYAKEESVEERDAGFRVQSYDLELKIQNQLSVRAELTIQPEEEREAYAFTLYRGYRVSSVQCGGRELPFSQEGDELTIFYPSEDAFTIWISYAGSSNKFYSNEKQTLLPGWFAWYPMPGRQAVFLTYEDYGLMYGYNPYARMEDAEVALSCNVPIVTNLNRVGADAYAGYTDGITVLGGNFIGTGEEAVPYCLPLLLEKGQTAGEYAREVEEQYGRVLANLEDEYGLDVSEWKGKQILLASPEMARNLTNDDIAVFGDYILAAPDGITEEHIAKYQILRDRRRAAERAASEEVQQLLFSFPSGDVEKDRALLQDWREEEGEW